MLEQPFQFREIARLQPVVPEHHPFRQPLRIEPRAIHQGHHIELHPPLKQPPVIRPPLHHQRKARQLRRTLVNIEAEEVLFEDQPRHIALPITALQVDGLEELIGFHEDVPGATGRVDERQLLGVELARRDGRELYLDLVGLLGRLDVILHLPCKQRLGIGRQPLRPQRVLDHVLHDPVGREELGRRWNVFRGHHLADDLVLLLRDVELVEPADDLDVGPVGFRDFIDQRSDQ
ncbi:MAG: hypothetical protein AW10_04224 [Candidatus Accumulibacter appositus]|uniref:Uncharacterized protein n=1 Tax=Candidatus Accumulibacter appositus TaxID=1454003 RepID=A0A011PD10_9PROT|nr:MAG: hypothetical protein AW10_04224 [Candidatus Accumulibacter appositus]